MLATKLIRRRNKRTHGESAGCVIFILIVIFLAAGLIQFLNWLGINADQSILSQAPGLVELVNTEDISRYSNLNITLASETFDAELFVIGVYTEYNDLFPIDTVAAVYTRDNWRFVEIDYLPITNVRDQIARVGGTQGDTVELTETIQGQFVILRDDPQCKDSKQENFPGRCEFTRHLFIELDDQLISIAADGSHATEGEMIGLAKSIISFDDTASE